MEILNYPPEILTYLRSGWLLYRNNVHDRWHLARYRGDGRYYIVPDAVIDELERAREISTAGPNQYVLNKPSE